MRKLTSSKRGLVLALAALLAVAVPGTTFVQAAARLSDAALLESQLPSGETLSNAPVKDLEAAIRAAVAKRPGAAAAIVKIAMLAKSTKKRQIPCDEVRDIVRSALAAAPDQSRSVEEMAQTLAPDCADAITEGLRGPIGGAPGSTEAIGGDFGAGFGPGFPGSPGFSGSSPSGGFALPTPVPTPVTQSVNG